MSSEPLFPAFDKNNVPVVFTVNENYVPVFSVVLESLMAHARAENNYDILLLADGISDSAKEMLLGQIRGKNAGNFSLRFVGVSAIKPTAESFLKGRRAFAAMYFRLFLSSLFPHYDKMLYLDTDVIVNADVAELYATELGDNFFAGAPDYGFLGSINKSITKALADMKSRGWDRREHYVNDGVSLFNLKKMREEQIEPRLVEFALRERLRYHDQDALNFVCNDGVRGNAVPLADKWNFCMHQAPLTYPPEYRKKCFEMLRDATYGIVHYVGVKPWKSAGRPLSYLWWRYAVKSPFFADFSTDYLAAQFSVLSATKRDALRCAILSRVLWGKRRRYYVAKSIVFRRELSILRAFLKREKSWAEIVGQPPRRLEEAELGGGVNKL